LKRAIAIALLAVPAAGLAAPGAAFTPCQLVHPAGIATVAAECTRIAVPEDHAHPGGRRIELFVARVPAISARKADDPLFIFAGGPGAAASEFYAGVAPAFARVNRDRDIVLVDQRGTGRSNALRCEFDDEAMLGTGEDDVQVQTRRCLAEVSGHAQPSLYTTSEAVRDLELVRRTLGYDRIDLYGVSYGTRVAQHYLRRHGDRVRAVVLDGVVPPQRILGPDMALDAEDALRHRSPAAPGTRPATRPSAIRPCSTARCVRGSRTGPARC